MKNIKSKLPQYNGLCAVLIFAPFWFELVFRGAALGGILCAGWTYMLPLSLVFGGVLALFSLPWRHPRAVSCVLLTLLGMFYGGVTIYVEVFGVLPSLYSATHAAQVFQFWRETLSAAWRVAPWLLLDFVPLALALCRKDGIMRIRVRTREWAALFLATLAVYLFTLAGILSAQGGNYPPRTLYFYTYLPMRSATLFGVGTSYMHDAHDLIFGAATDSSLTTADAYTDIDGDTAETETVYPDNVMNFDFEFYAANESNSAISELHSYFAAQTPTAQNEYTGMFAGKNLVLITAEGWSPYAVREDLTPTLYKMLHEGFVFENYYVPIWGVSTSDGEYTACQSLLPKTGTWSFYMSSANWLPFCMGNQMQSLGYTTKAYHDHLYDYYGRNYSHPNMGYDYKGYGNGLNITYTWPESDLEMIEITTDEYINSQPFLAYYMTVSGHLYYTYYGNMQASKHRDIVENLPLSEGAQAYLACNYELELAMQELLSRLEAAGIADDTVICIAPDHYPYGLSNEEYEELAGKSLDEVFERYHSSLIIYSPGMSESVTVTKPCNAIDILPTLSNLFGLEYDSRLLMGRDILSSSEGLVIFADRSWITERGRYDANTDTFTPNDGVTVPDGYVSGICQTVNAKFTVSARILDSNYYAVLWDAAGLPRRESSVTRSQLIAYSNAANAKKQEEQAAAEAAAAENAENTETASAAPADGES